MADSNSIKLCECGCGQPLPRFIRGHRLRKAGGSFAAKLAGSRFGRLLVVKRAGLTKQGQAKWLCVCDCGSPRIVNASNLVRGTTASCGCLAAESRRKSNRTHGYTDTPTYNAWASMRQRCYYQKQAYYPRYGGRGIAVCERWRDSFENFLADMGERPDGTSLDRINTDGNYEPSNCRWATRTQQARNRSNTALVEHNGLRLSIAEWAERTGIPAKTLYCRRYEGDKSPRLFRPYKRPPRTDKMVSTTPNLTGSDTAIL